MKKLKVLSLFDGMSCGQQALKRLNIPIDKYYASEIDKHAIKVTMANFPDTHQLGDVEKWIEWDIDWNIGLLFFGSPCQGFSFAGKGLNFNDPRSKLFFVAVDILNHIRSVNPNVKFLAENVRMKKEHERVFNEYLGVKGQEINSALVCAQNRIRIYWQNFCIKEDGFFNELISAIPQPKDRGILLKDILQPESEIDKKYYVSDKILQRLNVDNVGFVGFVGFKNEGKDSEKSAPLLARDYKGMSNYGINVVKVEGKARTVRSSGHGSLDKHNWDVIKVSKDGNVKDSQDKASTVNGGGHSGGNHSDMDLLMMIKENYVEWGEGYSQDNRAYYPESKSGCLDSKAERQKVIQINPSKESNGQQPFQQNRVYSTEGKAPHVSSQLSTGSDKIIVHNMSPRSGDPTKGGTGHLTREDGKTYCLQTSDINRVEMNFKIRRLTPIECERLQGVEDNYTNVVSDSQRYKMLGNGWQIDTIVHILASLPPVNSK